MTGREASSFLLGVGIGVGLGILIAPQAGEDTREWLLENAESRISRLRRRGRRLVLDAQDLLDKSEDTVTRVLRTGKDALDTVASKL
jgi:gas vesicle protein